MTEIYLDLIHFFTLRLFQDMRVFVELIRDDQ